MKTGLIVVGVIFLVVGVLLYFLPMQVFKADTTTMVDGNTDTRTSSARMAVPAAWSVASIVIGFILLIFGLVIPNPPLRSNPKKEAYERVVESKEQVESKEGTVVGDGNRHKIVRKRTEVHTSKKNDDFG